MPCSASADSKRRRRAMRALHLAHERRITHRHALSPTWLPGQLHPRVRLFDSVLVVLAEYIELRLPEVRQRGTPINQPTSLL